MASGFYEISSEVLTANGEFCLFVYLFTMMLNWRCTGVVDTGKFKCSRQKCFGNLFFIKLTIPYMALQGRQSLGSYYYPLMKLDKKHLLLRK